MAQDCNNPVTSYYVTLNTQKHSMVNL